MDYTWTERGMGNKEEPYWGIREDYIDPVACTCHQPVSRGIGLACSGLRNLGRGLQSGFGIVEGPCWKS